MFPGEVDLSFLESVACGVREGVMVVMPTLAKGEGGHPFVVAGSIAAVVGNGSLAVCCGVHKPGHVINEHES